MKQKMGTLLAKISSPELPLLFSSELYKRIAAFAGLYQRWLNLKYSVAVYEA